MESSFSVGAKASQYHSTPISTNRKLLGMPLFTGVCVGSPGFGTVEAKTHLITFASLHRRPISGCLREGGEVIALGLPESGLQAKYLGVLKLEGRDVESRGWGDEWEGLQACGLGTRGSSKHRVRCVRGVDFGPVCHCRFLGSCVA